MGGSGGSINQPSLLSGGLAGAVGRHFTQSAMQTMTGHAGNPISRRAFESSVKKGGGRIMGTETSASYPNGTAFGMYSAEQYMAPEGDYETVITADNATWYRQYATDMLERTPYMTGEGRIAYHENIVQKLPDMPKRKGRV